ncbi:transcription initiation factor IID, 31kD subunit-domain-containing protein [Auriculariales sp. MPI-PUGE-AT-0066]|nr:transcription initiation factor IID, 31kD subunit-domain-containing protein [Auriculariales sp. MPI-PUGE-AT-0066]
MAPPPEPLPSSARSIALLLASSHGVQDAQPGVLHQLLEFAHRYTGQVLTDALVYAEHAGRPSKLEREDVVLSVQARVGWEFGGQIPKEYLNTLAAQTNSVPLPPVPEVFGIRLPPENMRLTQPDFHIVPTQPPPDVPLFVEEEVEVDDDDDEDSDSDVEAVDEDGRQDEDMEDVEMEQVEPAGSDAGDDDDDDEAGLFREEEMEDVTDTPIVNGHPPPPVARNLVEQDDYD